MQEAIVIQVTTVMIALKCLFVPFIALSVTGYHYKYQRQPKYGARVWAPIVWVVTASNFLFWFVRGLFFT